MHMNCLNCFKFTDQTFMEQRWRDRTSTQIWLEMKTRSSSDKQGFSMRSADSVLLHPEKSQSCEMRCAKLSIFGRLGFIFLLAAYLISFLWFKTWMQVIKLSFFVLCAVHHGDQWRNFEINFDLSILRVDFYGAPDIAPLSMHSILQNRFPNQPIKHEVQWMLCLLV